MKEITDSIESGIRDVFTSGKYQQYLQTMSRFHRYSFNNTMLIFMQKPDATRVAGFNKWRDEFKRNVKKGEKGIKIIAPTPFKKKIGFYRKGWITEERMREIAKPMLKNQYGQYLLKVIEDVKRFGTGLD